MLRKHSRIWWNELLIITIRNLGSMETHLRRHVLWYMHIRRGQSKVTRLLLWYPVTVLLIPIHLWMYLHLGGLKAGLHEWHRLRRWLALEQWNLRFR